MMCDYQTLVHDSSRTLFEFRSNSLKAISNQKDAVELFNEKEFLDCLETISENKVLLRLYKTSIAMNIFEGIISRNGSKIKPISIASK